MAEKFTYITLDEEPETVVSTKEDICAQLESLGIQRGMVILVQADMKKLGYLIGGEQTLIEALMETVGYEGTIVMPTFTPQMADPACQKKHIARMYWEDVRQHALPFDKKLSAPEKADALIYQFLRNEGVVRSYHPLYSFAAWGKYAKILCDKHPLHFGLNQDSPLGKVSEFNGYVVLLGCDYNDCVMFQLARYHGEQLPIKLISAPIENNSRVQWKDMLELDFTKQDMGEIGEIMEDKSVVRTTYIGTAKCRFFSSREAVTLASSYFHIHNDEISMLEN